MPDITLRHLPEAMSHTPTSFPSTMSNIFPLGVEITFYREGLHRMFLSFMEIIRNYFLS